MTDRADRDAARRTRSQRDRSKPASTDETLLAAIAREVNTRSEIGGLGMMTLPRGDPGGRRARVHALQRTVGNAAVERMLRGGSRGGGTIQRQDEEEEGSWFSEATIEEAVDQAIEEAPAEGGTVEEPTPESWGIEEATPESEPVEEPVSEAEAEPIGEEAGEEVEEGIDAEGESESDEGSGLIVEDDAADVGFAQMRKGEFLGVVRSGVETLVAATLDDSAEAGPEIDRRFGQFGGMSAADLEATIQAQVPGASAVPAARLYVPLIVALVEQGLEGGDESGGETTPDEAAGGIEGGFNGLGRVLLMARHGGAAKESAGSIASQLGPGQALPEGARAEMGSAFGADFADVRVHTDAEADRIAGRLDARAFTIGRDIAFGAGEYHPGTPMGDALLAHELAHVVQQRSAGPGGAAMPMGEIADATLEEDADQAATGALAALWGRGKAGLGDFVQQAMPRLRSGIGIQSCKGKGKPKTDCLHPVNSKLADRFNAPKNFGMDVVQTWTAPEGRTLADLKGCKVREVLQFSDIPFPPFTAHSGSGKDTARSGQKQIKGDAFGEMGRTSDSHTHPRHMVTTPPTPANYSVDQTYEYRCPGCGDDWVPFDHYVIRYEIRGNPGGPMTFVTSKSGDGGKVDPMEEQFETDGQ